MNIEKIKIFLTSKVFLAILGVAVFFVLIIVFLTPKREVQINNEEFGGPFVPPPKPKNQVVRVEPFPDSKNISTYPSIVIVFQESITGKKVNVVSNPKIIFDSKLSNQGYTLTLVPKKNLKPSTKYKLNVELEKVSIFSWAFTTVKNTVDQNIIKNIRSKLPYQGNHFRITYTEDKDEYVVVINSQPIETYKQEALNWFSSQGLTDAENKINIFFYPVGDAIPPGVQQP